MDVQFDLDQTLMLAAYVQASVARAIDGLRPAAFGLAWHCAAARDLCDLLTVPDDEVFVATR